MARVATRKPKRAATAGAQPPARRTGKVAVAATPDRPVGTQRGLVGPPLKPRGKGK